LTTTRLLRYSTGHIYVSCILTSLKDQVLKKWDKEMTAPSTVSVYHNSTFILHHVLEMSVLSFLKKELVSHSSDISIRVLTDHLDWSEIDLEHHLAWSPLIPLYVPHFRFPSLVNRQSSSRNTDRSYSRIWLVVPILECQTCSTQRLEILGMDIKRCGARTRF
jgi:hypothetical protein